MEEALQQTLAQEDKLVSLLQKRKLRGVETPDGWLVDAADLFKAFPLPSGVLEPAPVLKVVVEHGVPTFHEARLQELLELERQRSAELRLERDRWATLVERIALPVATGLSTSVGA